MVEPRPRNPNPRLVIGIAVLIWVLSVVNGLHHARQLPVDLCARGVGECGPNTLRSEAMEPERN